MANLRHRLLATILFTTFSIYSAFAQSNLTQILDNIQNPDATAFNGTIVITWNGFSGSGVGAVSRVNVSARVYNGALSVFLVPTTTAAPGTYYQVAYSSSNGLSSWTETWQVPPSTTPLMVSQVRVTNTGGGPGNPPGSGVQYATLPISISQITNLSANLSSINSSVSSLTTQVNSLAATVGSTGSLSGLQATVNNLSATVTSLSSTVTGLNSSLSSLSSTVNTNGTTLTNLSGTVTGLSSTVSGNTNSITTLTNNLSTLTSTVNGQGTSISGLSTTVGGLNTSVTNLSGSLSALTTVVNTLSAAGSTAMFVDAETPSGTIDGVNTTFTLANPPAPTTSLTLFRNGLMQRAGIDFTLSGTSITFVSGNVPRSGDMMRAYYRVPGTGSPTNFTDGETPSGTINGANLTFTLVTTPNPAASLKLTKNGLLLTQGTDYALSGATISFANTTVTPQTGDTLSASYRH